MKAAAIAAASLLAGFSLSASRQPSDQERIQALPAEERFWLTLYVAPILLPEEKEIFLTLTEPYQREGFKRTFWERRERENLAAPMGPGYRQRYDELWKTAQEKYDGWQHDAGRMLIRWGMPDDILQPMCGGEDVFYGIEVWTYHRAVASVGSSTMEHIFYRRFRGGPLFLWSLDVGNKGVFATGQDCRVGFEDLARDCGIETATTKPCAGSDCEDRCRVYETWLRIKARQGTPLAGLMETARIYEPEKVPTEGLDREKSRWAAASDPKAKPIHLEGPSDHPATQVSPTPAEVPPQRRPSLSADEIRARIELLEPKYREWLDTARPLMNEAELVLFLQLSAREKDDFMAKFWKDRS